MKFVVYIISFLVGIGQNLPYESLYIGGIGFGDFLLILMLVAIMLGSNSRTVFFTEIRKNYQLFQLIIIFVVLTLLSMYANLFTRNLDLLDLIEAVRPLYYFALAIFFIIQIKKFGISVVSWYVFGILISVTISYLEAENRDVFGFVLLWNPNVIGNMIAVGILLSSILIIYGKVIDGAVLAFPLVIFSVMTYSKGTWLMVSLGIIACIIAALNCHYPKKLNVKLFAYLVLCGFIALVVSYSEDIYTLFEYKLIHTQFEDSAVDGGTFSARWGFVRASAYLALTNPVFGVGISNFESAYDSLAEMLGSDYWATDNPHSAFLYLIACFGLPATFVFFAIFYKFATRLFKAMPLTGYMRIVYCYSIILMLLISGATQLQILTQHFFWFVMAVVYALQPHRRSFLPLEYNKNTTV